MDTPIAKPTKGLKRLVVWPLTADEGTAAPTYGEAHEFIKRLMTASDNPSIAEGSVDADNQTVEEAVERSGGDLDIGLTALTAEEEALLYGSTLKNGTNVSNINDIGAYVAAAYMTNRSDGLVNIYKYPKVRFSPQSQSFSTKKKGSVEFATIQIKGKYIPLVYNGDVCYERKAVDPVKDAEIINKWFTDGSYYGANEAEASTAEG